MRPGKRKFKWEAKSKNGKGGGERDQPVKKEEKREGHMWL